MKYYTNEFQISESVQRNAGIKARDDINTILADNGWKPIDFEFFRKRLEKGKIDKIKTHFKLYKIWNSKLNFLKKGDTLLLQFPVINHTLLFYYVVKKLMSKGVTVVLLVHDLDIIRAALDKNKGKASVMRINMEEKRLLMLCNCIIVHNDNMKSFIKSNLGVDDKKMITLDLFDYLIPGYDSTSKTNRTSIDMPVIIAGNLRPNKAGYVYSLPDTPEYNLYGVGFEDCAQHNLHYMGSFLPDELPGNLVGSFGLIWDGTSAETCAGVYGEYLKVNNPHKTSLYLASGIPVIIWKYAALAEYIKKHKCGILVESLYEITDAINSISCEEYNAMRENAINISKKITSGHYTLKALKRIQL